jgi:hypothetical protein
LVDGLAGVVVGAIDQGTAEQGDVDGWASSPRGEGGEEEIGDVGAVGGVAQETRAVGALDVAATRDWGGGAAEGAALASEDRVGEVTSTAFIVVYRVAADGGKIVDNGRIE